MFRQSFRERGSDEVEDEMEGGDAERKPRMPHMFCKILTTAVSLAHHWPSLHLSRCNTGI